MIRETSRPAALLRASVTVAAITILPIGIARAQTIDTLPATGAAAQAEEVWTVDSVEVPAEISYATMAVNMWVRVHRDAGRSPLASLMLVLKEADGDVRVPMRALDGALDTDREDAVATVDTYAWVREEAHPWEVWACAAEGAPRRLAKGAIRVKARVATPDLVLVDERGVATAWIGSGGGGFIAGAGVDCGIPLAGPAVRNVSGDRRPEIVVPAVDGALQVFESERSGRLESVRAVGCGIGLSAAALGDLDGDGGFDLVTALTPRLLELRRDLDDLPSQIADLPAEVEYLTLADLDGDGRQEIYLALLGLSEESIEVWAPGKDDPKEWGPCGVLSPPNGGRGRLRGIVALEPAQGRKEGALLVLSAKGGEGVLESWGGTADTESVDHLDAPRVTSLPGEPLGAVSGRFSDPAAPSWLVWVRRADGVEWWEVPLRGTPFPRGRLEAEPAAVVALDLDGDGDDDLATGGEELRLWINIRGADFREAGESPYLLEARVVALATGRLDE